MHHKHSNSRPWIVLVWAGVLFLWAVTATGYPRPVAADDAGPITEPPISSGAETGYPPFSMVDKNGRAGGFSVELLRAALSAMGHQVTFRTGLWSQVRAWLEKGEIQVLPLVSRTPERETLFDFTVPYMTLHGTIVVREGQTGIRSLEDLAGRQVAVMKGDNAEEFLRRGSHVIRIQTTPTFETALEELSRGLHDAVVIQRLVALRLIQKTGLTDLRLVEQPLEDFRQDFCFAVQEGDKDLLALLNEGLAIVMADGTYRRLHARWFASMQLPTDRPILVGGDRNYPPYEFLDEKGRPAGFNVDLTRAIARETGIHVEIRLGRWPERVNALKTGKIDMIQGMFYSPARNLAFDFSPVHTVSHYVAVVRKGEGPAPESLEEIGEKRIVVERGDIMHDYLLETAPQIIPVLVDDQEAALGELALGLHDCALVSRTTALYLMEKQGWSNLVPGKKMLLAPEYCYAAAKGNKALLASFSEGLKALEASGEYRRIHEKWLGVYQEDPPSFTRVLRYSALVILPLLAVLAAAFVWSMALRRQVARKTGELKESLDRIQHLNRVLRAIRGINRLIAREQGREHLIQKGCRLLVEGRGYLSALIVLTDDENTPALWAIKGLAGASEALRDLLSRGALPHCCSRARPGTDILLVRRRDRVCTGCPLMSSCTRSQSMCTPLVHGDRLFGYLTVAAEDGQAIDEEEKGLFSEMAEDFAYALNTMRISDDRRQGRADLDKSEARFRLMVESAPEPIFIQTDHCFAYVNPKAVALFGAKEAGDLIGTPVMERCHPDYREIVIRRIRSLNRDRRPVEELLELRFLRLDGSEVWVETTGQPMQYDGRDGALVFVRDISLRKRHEQEHEKLSAQFLQAQKMESVGRRGGPRLQQHAQRDHRVYRIGAGRDGIRSHSPSRPKGGAQCSPPVCGHHPAVAGLCPQTDHCPPGAGSEQDHDLHAQDAAAAHRRGHRPVLAARSGTDAGFHGPVTTGPAGGQPLRQRPGRHQGRGKAHH